MDRRVTMALALEPLLDGVRLPLKVVPNASRTRIAGLHGTALKVAVAAPPEKGKANRAVLALLADVLGVKRNQLDIDKGLSSAQKSVRITGVSADAVLASLKPFLD